MKPMVLMCLFLSLLGLDRHGHGEGVGDDAAGAAREADVVERRHAIDAHGRRLELSKARTAEQAHDVQKEVRRHERLLVFHAVGCDAVRATPNAGEAAEEVHEGPVRGGEREGREGEKAKMEKTECQSVHVSSGLLVAGRKKAESSHLSGSVKKRFSNSHTHPVGAPTKFIFITVAGVKRNWRE